MRRVTGALLLVALLAPGSASHVRAQQPDAVAALRALRVVPAAAAPDVAFQTLEGGAARLDRFKGRPVLLTFFTTW